MGGGLGALFLLILIAAVASIGKNGAGPSPKRIPAPAAEAAPPPEPPRPPEIRPDPPPERRAAPLPPPKSILPPEEILRRLEAFAASSSDPSAILQLCDEALGALKGKPEEAKAREIEAKAVEKRRGLQVNSSIEEARKLRESDPKFERSEEILRLLRAAAGIAGSRRPEVEKLIADYEARAGEAAARAAAAPKTGEPARAESPAPPPPPPEAPAIEVLSFTLINADTDQPIPEFDPLPDGAVLNLARLPTRALSIRANTKPEKVGSVRFGLDAIPSKQLEKQIPYALAGSQGSNYDPWTPTLGTHTVTATPYANPAGTGPHGKILTVTFTVADKPPGRPPAVALRGPAGGSATVPGRIALAAEASDPDGHVVKVEFFRGATLIGSAGAAPYACAWDALHPGVYELTARATDDSGDAAVSPPVRVTLKAGGPMAVSFQDGVSPDPNYAGTRDATISESHPDKIHGSSRTCEIDGDDDKKGKDVCALIRWDLSSISPGSRVQSASVTLHLTEKGSALPYGLYEVKRDWSETEATWNACARGKAWETPGGRSPLDRGTEVLGTLPNREAGDVTLALNPDGIARVQSWIDAPAANHGIIISGPDIREGSAFVAREGARPEQRPRITLVLGAGGKLVHYEGFEKGPGKFQGGAVVEGGLNGSRALSAPAEGAWIEGIPFPPVGPSTLARFWIKPPGNVGQIEVIAWSRKLKANIRTHAKGLRPGEWNRVEVLLIRMHQEWNGTGPTLEGEAPQNFRVHLADVPADARFLLDEFEIFE